VQQPGEVLVWSDRVVPEAEIAKQAGEGFAALDFEAIELRLEGTEEPLDAAVLPKTARGGELLANAGKPSHGAKDGTAKHRFVVGAKGLGFAETTDSEEEVPEQRPSVLAFQRLQD
jgi:hypothetical protein